MWLARYAGFRHPNSHVSSGGLGHDGLLRAGGHGRGPGRPDREAWAITGDGGFQMTFQELMTLVQDRLPVKIALFDNKKLGMIRQWQEIIYAGNYHSAHLLGPDFPKLAEAFGIPAFRARPRRGRRRSARPGRRRSGAHLVRDRRGAERLPDDAGRQGPVRPHREVGRGGRMSADPELEWPRRCPPPTRRTPLPRRPGLCPAAASFPPRARGHRHEQARRPQPGVQPHAGAELHIDSLAVSKTDREDISRMTITLHGDDVAVEQAAKQLYRLIDVLKVQDVTSDRRRARARVRQGPGDRREPPEVVQLVELYRAGSWTRPQVAHRGGDRHGGRDRRLGRARPPIGIKELVRAGTVVMATRGSGCIEESVKR